MLFFSSHLKSDPNTDPDPDGHFTTRIRIRNTGLNHTASCTLGHHEEPAGGTAGVPRHEPDRGRV